MNIWMFNHYAVAPDMPGGTRHYDVAKELTKHGHNVVIFASSFHYSLHKELKLNDNRKYLIEDMDNVKFVWIKTYKYDRNNWKRVVNMTDYTNKVYHIAKKLGKGTLPKPDVIIGSSVHLLTPLSAYYLSKHYNVPFIMEVRDIWPDTLVDMGLISENHFATKILYKLERFLYRKASRIIYVPPKAGDYFTGIGIRREKVINIPNGVNLNRFPIDENRSLKDTDDEFTIMYAGHFGPSAGLDKAVEAMNIVVQKGYKNIVLNLAGDGSERQSIEALIDKYGLGENVKTLGVIPKDKIADYLLKSDALLHIEFEFSTSKWGGSPNKIYDYLATGKPIIYSSNFVKEWLDSIGCGVYSVPGNEEDLSRAIIELINMPAEERRALGLKGREHVENNNDISVLANKFMNTINESIQEG